MLYSQEYFDAKVKKEIIVTEETDQRIKLYREVFQLFQFLTFYIHTHNIFYPFPVGNLCSTISSIRKIKNTSLILARGNNTNNTKAKPNSLSTLFLDYNEIHTMPL